MGQMQRNGHVSVGFVRRVAEHHTLVASTLLFLVGAIDTAIDVGTLLVNGGENTAGIAVELVFRLRVADFVDGSAGHRLQVDVSLRTNFAHDDDLTRRHKRFHGATSVLVVGEKLV